VNERAPSPALSTIELNNVSYEIDGRRILEAASWQVRPGEHWAVLGPNGAGKTTLLRIVCGYLWPNAGGEVRRCGRVLTDLRELRRSIGWVTCSLLAEIPPRQRVLDTVVAGRFAQTALLPMAWDPPTAEDYARAEKLLAQFALLPLRDQAFGTLSQGEQQKVLIARARMAAPLLIVLDEPCAGLDPAARESLLLSLQQMAETEQKLSLVLVTHHVEEIVPAIGNLVALRSGRIVVRGRCREQVNADLIEQLYGTRPAELIEHSGRWWPIW